MAHEVSLLDFPETHIGTAETTIYGPEQCPKCDTVARTFDRKGTPYTRVTITPGDEHHRYITQDLGYMQAPVITVKINDRLIHWNDIRIDLMSALYRYNVKA